MTDAVAGPPHPTGKEAPAKPDANADTTMDDSATPGRRSSRRSAARKVVNYSTHFDLGGDSEEEGVDGVASSGTPSRRGRRRAPSDGGSGDEFRPEDAGGGKGGHDGDGEDEEDDDFEEDEQDDDDDEEEQDADEDEDVLEVAPRRKGKASTAATARAATTSSSSAAIPRARSSASKRPPKSVAAGISTKSHFAAHERRPAWLPGTALDGGCIASRDLLPLHQIGRSRPALVSLTSMQQQMDGIAQVRSTWSNRTHYTQTRCGKARSNNVDLAVFDTSWYPGKTTSASTERKRRTQIAEFWRGDGSDSALMEEIQVVGGVFLVNAATSQRPTIPSAKSRSRYLPPPPSSTAENANLEHQRDIKTFDEQGPTAATAQGDLDVVMGTNTVKLEKGKAKTLRDCAVSVCTTGFIANCGSFIASVDWAPKSVHSPIGTEYLALGVQISSPPGTVPRSVLGTRNQDKTPGLVQIWSIGGGSGGSALQLEFSLGIPVGEVVQVKWCPAGFDLRDGQNESDNGSAPPHRIGILACALTCGKIVLYAVPRPGGVKAAAGQQAGEPPIIELAPLLELTTSASEPVCLEWSGGERLIAGCSNGSLLVWHIGHLLRSLANPDVRPIARPSHSVQVHEMAITSVSFLPLPPWAAADTDDDKDDANLDGLPHFVLTTGLDGSTRIVDLDTADVSVEAQKQREAGYATSFLPFLSMWVSERGDNAVRMVNPRPAYLGRTHLIGLHQGRSTTLDGSSFHPLVASGSADGTVVVLPVLRNVMKHEERINWPIYRLELNRATGALRFIDNFTTTSYQHTGGGGDAATLGAHHPSIRITSVAWCPNLAANPFLLASSTACGLLRIDLVAGDEGPPEGEAAENFRQDQQDVQDVGMLAG